MGQYKYTRNSTHSRARRGGYSILDLITYKMHSTGYSISDIEYANVYLTTGKGIKSFILPKNYTAEELHKFKVELGNRYERLDKIRKDSFISFVKNDIHLYLDFSRQ